MLHPNEIRFFTNLGQFNVDASEIQVSIYDGATEEERRARDHAFDVQVNRQLEALKNEKDI